MFCNNQWTPNSDNKSYPFIYLFKFCYGELGQLNDTIVVIQFKVSLYFHTLLIYTIHTQIAVSLNHK